jgi:uncharacterized protein (DUF1778 family)
MAKQKATIQISFRATPKFSRQVRRTAAIKEMSVTRLIVDAVKEVVAKTLPTEEL